MLILADSIKPLLSPSHIAPLKFLRYGSGIDVRKAVIRAALTARSLGLHDLDLYSACGAGNLAGSNHFEKLRFSPPSSSDSGRFRELIRFPTPYVSPVLASRQGGKRGV